MKLDVASFGIRFDSVNIGCARWRHVPAEFSIPYLGTKIYLLNLLVSRDGAVEDFSVAPSCPDSLCELFCVTRVMSAPGYLRNF